MAHFNLRFFLGSLAEQKESNVFVLQIGAMDGKMFDPMFEYINKYRWSGLLVEPIEKHFEQLRVNYSCNDNVAFENSAIAEHCGTATMYTVPSEFVLKGDVPKWGLGVTSLYNNRNALAFEEIRSLVTQIEVSCITLPELLVKHQVEHVDVLQIDTEGYDYHIIKQLDFATFHPKVINMEVVNLPGNEKKACYRLLDKHGYIHIKAGYDLLAVSLKWLGTLG